ncbi:MAG: MBL fold metallo-hydrolase [Clostridia bacterium]|nr:MBL fold metallo-hydrolase [Clostridia bacterium]
MNQKTRIYQIQPEASSLMECYIIVTKENKVIVIDGGRDGYGKDFPPYLQSAVRAVLGIGETDDFEIEAWFLSHAHTDHIYELAKLLNAYDENAHYRIKNLYFNFPPVKAGWESKGGEGDYSLDAMEALKNGLSHYAEITGQSGFLYDHINGAVINWDAIRQGLTITIDDCDIDVLRTWEDDDLIVNSTSTVLRLRCHGKSVLFLGDAYTDTGDKLLKQYGADALRSDYVQLAHHGQHGCTKEFYLAIGTDHAHRLWPAPAWVWGTYHHPAIASDETRTWFGLPENPEEYFAKGFDRTGMDLVAGHTPAYPADPTKVSDWTREILSAQLAAEF